MLSLNPVRIQPQTNVQFQGAKMDAAKKACQTVLENPKVAFPLMNVKVTVMNYMAQIPPLLDMLMAKL